MTVITLSESQKQIQGKMINKDYNTSETRQFRTLRVLHRLVEKSATEIEAMNVELAALVHKDALTGLYNRRRFDEKLRFEVKRHLGTGEPISLILLDIDYFKNYNDAYGHVAGDDCLRGVGQVIQNMKVSAEYIRARYGGEEFAIIMPGADYKEVCKLSEDIRKLIESLKIKHSNSDVSQYVTASLGCLTAFVESDVKPEVITEAGDKLLYAAKAKGRNISICEIQIF